MQRSSNCSSKHLLRTAGEVVLLDVWFVPSKGCADVNEPRRLTLVRPRPADARDRQCKGSARCPIQGARRHLACHFRMVGRLLLKSSAETPSASLLSELQ
jgi:hypothetical protein